MRLHLVRESTGSMALRAQDGSWRWKVRLACELVMCSYIACGGLNGLDFREVQSSA